MDLLAGALLERPPGGKYVSELRFAELAPQPPLPKPDTLAKWRERLPSDFEVALRAPRTCWEPDAGPLRAGPALDAGIEWLTAAADALAATALVVSTGASVTTGARDRERLRRFFGRLPRSENRLIVWRATGLWEAPVLAEMANALSVIGAVDPLDDPVPRGDVVYAHLFAEGLRQSFSHASLDEVVQALRSSGAARAYVSIASADSFREARLLQALGEGRL